MLFNSFDFALFFPTVFVLYWFVFAKYLKTQNFFLLVVSYIFYGWWDWRYLSLIFLSSLCDYLVGRSLGTSENQSFRRLMLATSMIANLGCLAVFKYFDFFASSLQSAFDKIGIQLDPLTLNLVLPVGISFYTFQTMSYTIDVYRRKMAPSNDPIAFFAYVAFFPQLVAGPIERAANLLPQFMKRRNFTYQQAAEGLCLMLWGLFKKIVVADNCAVIANRVFDNYQTAPGYILVVGVIAFAFQIYGDFSGYSSIARGAAKLLGFELMVNFRTPYFSRDIAEFWRRWHISLSTWFKDYLYIPLGGSKGSTFLIIRNTFVIFLVSGLWHGANWTFVVWGFLNALYFLPLILVGKHRRNVGEIDGLNLKNLLGIMTTFLMTCFAWIFFRSPTLEDAFAYISRMVTSDFFGAWEQNIPMIVLFPLIVLILVDWKFRNSNVDLIVSAKGKRYFSIGVCIMLLLFRYTGKELEFIYFQF